MELEGGLGLELEDDTWADDHRVVAAVVPPAALALEEPIVARVLARGPSDESSQPAVKAARSAPLEEVDDDMNDPAATAFVAAPPFALPRDFEVGDRIVVQAYASQDDLVGKPGTLLARSRKGWSVRVEVTATCFTQDIWLQPKHMKLLVP